MQALPLQRNKSYQSGLSKIYEDVELSLMYDKLDKNTSDIRSVKRVLIKLCNSDVFTSILNIRLKKLRRERKDIKHLIKSLKELI